MRFAHMADCHIGGWRDEKLSELGKKAFIKAIDACILRAVDFVLISGDLFNTSLPSVEDLKAVVKKFKELKKAQIPIYLTAGSHDFSPSGKTILDVLEEAELCINVVKADRTLTEKEHRLVLRFTVDAKTGAKITGMLGKKGMLERVYYQDLFRKNLEQEDGFKVFLFHTAITELKPKELERMDSSPLSLLPRNFDYYAGGHVHIVKAVSLEGYRNVVYPGPLFPNNFAELEKLGKGGFYIYDEGAVEYVPVEVRRSIPIKISAERKSPESVTQEILEAIDSNKVNDSLVLLRIEGTLISGKPGDVDFRRIYSEAYGKGAYFVMRNTLKLRSAEFEEVKQSTGTVDEIEQSLISAHIGKFKVEGWDTAKEKEMTTRLLHLLDDEKREGEKVYEFEERIVTELNKLLGKPQE